MLKIVLLTVLLIPVANAVAQPAQPVPTVPAATFDAFAHCGDKALRVRLRALLAAYTPVEKTEGEWLYAVRSKAIGLTIRAVALGVCSSEGNYDCGWGWYLAVYPDVSFRKARAVLKKRTGIDYTKEKRTRGTKVTERPILATDEQRGRSVLFCDPGEL